MLNSGICGVQKSRAREIGWKGNQKRRYKEKSYSNKFETADSEDNDEEEREKEMKESQRRGEELLNRLSLMYEMK